MNIKKTLLAMAAMAAFACAALPAVASADEVLYENPNFTVASSGGTELRTENATVTCSGTSGSGSFENSSTGVIELTFSGCKAFGTPCTTAGQSSGTITTTTLPFHVESVGGNASPAILITPNEGHFASFKCAFGTVTVVVGGNGVVGEITDPGYEEESSTFTIDFNAEGAAQEYTQVDGDSTTYNLVANINGEEEVAAQVGEGTGTFASGKAEIVE